MAGNGSLRKPRIRKTAPSVRQKVEQAKEKAEKPKAQRRKRVLSAAGRVASPVRRLKPQVRVPQNSATKPLFIVGRVLKKILRPLAPRYFVNSWRELRQVTWTSRRETWRLTSAVFIFAIVFGALVAGVDKGLDIIFKNLVLK
ncbi:MAG TPA: preprotein translocase subunit SecE [Candidatus Saccharimonadales bacterium]|nr:preprotein translocase subunit SecE [Candidatus Saccharimonadales bacterium]